MAVVVDLFSRRVIGWSMKSRITKELVLDALLMAVWHRSPIGKVLVHSDQGSQYTSHDWDCFLKQHGLESSMSRRGNCHDNAVVESFSSYSKEKELSGSATPLERKLVWTSSNILRCSTTLNADMVPIISCRQ